MKLLFIFLLLTSYYHLSTAQMVQSSTNSSQRIQDFNDIPLEIVENNAFIKKLINYGDQVVLGHAFESGLIGDIFGLYLVYPEIYDVSFVLGDTLNLTADVFINLDYFTTLRAIFLVYYDPRIEYIKCLSFSYEWQNSSFNATSGFNISYNLNQDSYEVISFNGLQETLTYRTQTPLNQTSYSALDFREKFSNWTSINASEIYDNQTLQYAFNAALRGIRQDDISLLADYGDLNVTMMHTIETYSVFGAADYFRYDFDFKTANQSGHAVCMVSCLIDYYQYPPYWPPFYPQFPLTVAADGTIISSTVSESIGGYGEECDGEECGEEYYQEEGEEEYLPVPEEEVNEESSESNESNGTNSSKSLLPTQASKYTPGYSNYNCLYASLGYYWFVEFKGTS